MNPALIALIARAFVRTVQEVPAAKADVEAAPSNFEKGMAALNHLESVFADLFGDFETHAASVGVPSAPVKPAATV
jgi:hypothetical protein